jgi:hypothetical protein
MVSVPCERGYTIGFVAREILGDELLYKISDPSWKPKKIHTHLLDEDHSIKQTLKTKIDTENYALSHCKVLMRGHRSGSLAEVLATEFQYDNKRLTVYIKKFEDLSVCRLVRKLNEKFRTRISVVEVDNLEEIHARAMKYLSLSQLSVSEEKISNTNHCEKSSQSFLLMKYQQLNGTSSATAAVHSSSSSSSCSSSIASDDESITLDYQHYGPFHCQSKGASYQFDDSSSSSSSPFPPPGFGPHEVSSYSPPSSFRESEFVHNSSTALHRGGRGVIPAGKGGPGGAIVPSLKKDFNSSKYKNLSSPLLKQYFSSTESIPSDWLNQDPHSHQHQPQHQQEQEQSYQCQQDQLQNFNLFGHQQQLRQQQQHPYLF